MDVDGQHAGAVLNLPQKGHKRRIRWVLVRLQACNVHLNVFVHEVWRHDAVGHVMGPNQHPHLLHIGIGEVGIELAQVPGQLGNSLGKGGFLLHHQAILVRDRREDFPRIDPAFRPVQVDDDAALGLGQVFVLFHLVDHPHEVSAYDGCFFHHFQERRFSVTHLPKDHAVEGTASLGVAELIEQERPARVSDPVRIA